MLVTINVRKKQFMYVWWNGKTQLDQTISSNKNIFCVLTIGSLSLCTKIHRCDFHEKKKSCTFKRWLDEITFISCTKICVGPPGKFPLACLDREPSSWDGNGGTGMHKDTGLSSLHCRQLKAFVCHYLVLLFLLLFVFNFHL